MEAGIYAMPRPDPSDESSFLPDFQRRSTDKSDVAGVSWKADLSKRARAILRAGGTVVVGGGDADGGFLQIFSANDGAARREKRLEASPVWDGLAVAAGRLYVPLENGTLVCLGEN